MFLATSRNHTCTGSLLWSAAFYVLFFLLLPALELKDRHRSRRQRGRPARSRRLASHGTTLNALASRSSELAFDEVGYHFRYCLLTGLVGMHPVMDSSMRVG